MKKLTIIIVVIIAIIWGVVNHFNSPMGNIDISKIPAKSAYQLTTGETVTLPIEYQDWTWMAATFTFSAKQAQEILPEKLKPLELTPGKALISIGLLDYPQVSSLNPYKEWFVAIPVQYDPAVNLPFLPMLFDPTFPSGVYKKGGSYVYYLPVTTQDAYQAGIEIWGFPKVVRQVQCQEDGNRKSCQLSDNGTFDMSLEIEKPEISNKDTDFMYCAYTEKDTQLLRTCIPMRGDYGSQFFGKATLKLGSGAVAEKLKSFNIDLTNPAAVFYAENLSSQLPLEYERLGQ